MTTAELVENSKQTQEARNQPQSNHAPLFDDREAGDLRTRWQNIQGAFVDDPQASVSQADQPSPPLFSGWRRFSPTKRRIWKAHGPGPRMDPPRFQRKICDRRSVGIARF